MNREKSSNEQMKVRKVKIKEMVFSLMTVVLLEEFKINHQITVGLT